jgi:hypothetical protein
MIVIRRESEWLKEVITIEEGKERSREQNKYAWSFVEYLYTLNNTLEHIRFICKVILSSPCFGENIKHA